MKKINQKGTITPVQILIVFLVVAVLGFVAYRITQTKTESTQSDSTEVDLQSQDVEPEETAQDDSPAISIQEIDPAIELVTVSDIAKLPDNTPESFVEYMTAELEANVTDEIGCIALYRVSKISELNISGGVGGTTPDNQTSDICGGGAKVVWSIDKSTQTWSEFGFQAVPLCSDIPNIYTEFIQSCLQTSDSDKFIDNPNGSIYDAI